MVAQERRFTPRRHRRRMRNQQQYYGYSEQERGGRGGGYGQGQGQQRGGPIRRHQQSHSEFGIQGRRETEIRFERVEESR